MEQQWPWQFITRQERKSGKYVFLGCASPKEIKEICNAIITDPSELTKLIMSHQEIFEYIKSRAPEGTSRFCFDEVHENPNDSYRISISAHGTFCVAYYGKK